MKIGITGGTGFIGSHIAQTLCELGHDLRCLLLPGEPEGWLAGLPVDIVRGDILNSESLRPFVRDREVIVHLAGLTRARSEEEFLAVNAGGTENLLRTALESGTDLRHFVFMSSLSAAGPSGNGDPISEETPPEPVTAYGRSKLEAERIAYRYAPRVPYTAIRAPGVFGPRDRDYFMLVQMQRKGLRLYVPGGRTVPLVYVENLVQGIASILGNPAAFNQAFFLVDYPAVGMERFMELIDTYLGTKSLPIPVHPRWFPLLSLLGKFMQFCTGKPSILNPEKLREVGTERWSVSSGKAKRILGYETRIDLETAIARTVDWYFASGWCPGERAGNTCRAVRGRAESNRCAPLRSGITNRDSCISRNDGDLRRPPAGERL